MFKGAKKTIIIMIFATVLVSAGIVAGFLIHAKTYVKEQLAAYGDTILTNVYVENINVSEMTKSDAKVLVTNYIENNMDQRDLELIAGDRKKKIKISEFKIDYNIDDAIEKAYDVGREGTLFSKYFLFHKMQDELKRKTIKLERTIDEQNVTSALKKNVDYLNHKPINASLNTVNKDGKLTAVVVKEADGQSVDVEDSSDKIFEYLSDKWDLENTSMKLNVETTPPEITSKDLEDMTDILGMYSTKIVGSRATKNLHNAAGKLNGSIIEPNSTLSLFEKLGPFSKENGYISALSTFGNVDKMIMGGGVGQASTAVYLAAVVSELEIEERQNYGILTDYAKPAFDAALQDKDVDLKINNNTSNSIYLRFAINKKNIDVVFFGKKENSESREVRLESKITKRIPAKVEIIKDKKLLKGQKTVVKKGQDGCEAQLWKAVYVDGKFDSREKVNDSKYSAITRVEKVGTKKKKKKKKKKNPNILP